MDTYRVICDDGYWMIEGPGFLPIGYDRDEVIQLRNALTSALEQNKNQPVPDEGRGAGRVALEPTTGGGHPGVTATGS